MKPNKPQGKSERSRRNKAQTSAINSSAPPVLTFTAPLAPLSTRATSTLPYVQQVTFTTGASYTFGATDTVIYLNDIYTPSSNNPHQPYGHDEMANLYTYYKVVKAVVTITSAMGATDTLFLAARLRPPGVTTSMAGTTVSATCERPGTKLVIDRPGAPVVFMKFDVPMHTALGVTKAEFDADVSQFAALVGASPSIRAAVNYNAACIGTNTAVPTIFQVEYTVQWWGRKTLTQS